MNCPECGGEPLTGIDVTYDVNGTSVLSNCQSPNRPNRRGAEYCHFDLRGDVPNHLRPTGVAALEPEWTGMWPGLSAEGESLAGER